MGHSTEKTYPKAPLPKWSITWNFSNVVPSILNNTCGAFRSISVGAECGQKSV